MEEAVKHLPSPWPSCRSERIYGPMGRVRRKLRCFLDCWCLATSLYPCNNMLYVIISDLLPDVAEMTDIWWSWEAFSGTVLRYTRICIALHTRTHLSLAHTHREHHTRTHTGIYIYIYNVYMYICNIYIYIHKQIDG